MKSFRNWLIFLFGLIILFLFFYFRLKPIINQTFPYTFDQGRDFLKAEEIMRYHKPTLLGPTTGINGIFHGVWWYYYLAVLYLFSNGAPQLFAYGIMITTFLAVFLFAYFLKKNFGLLSAFLFFILITGSSYFIKMSSFAISSVFEFPFILLLFFSFYNFVKSKNPIFGFLVFFSLANIFEVEVPMGLFTIPAFLLSVIFLNQIKLFFENKKSFFYSLLGFIIPFVPRVIFEIKNGFLQEKAALNLFTHPEYRVPKVLIDILKERIEMFFYYFRSLFPFENIYLIIATLIVTTFAIFIVYKKLTDNKKMFLKFLLLMLAFLFLLSCIYKGSFWYNYYEGLSFYFALVISISVGSTIYSKNRLLKYSSVLLLIIIFIFNILLFKQYISDKSKIPDEGLISHLKIMDLLAETNKNRDFCVRIYTPPAIPHTYNYLLSYYKKIGKIKNYSNSYIDNQCFYVIEKDSWQFRIDKFRKEHIPEKAQLIKKFPVTKNADIELWHFITN